MLTEETQNPQEDPGSWRMLDSAQWLKVPAADAVRDGNEDEGPPEAVDELETIEDAANEAIDQIEDDIQDFDDDLAQDSAEPDSATDRADQDGDDEVEDETDRQQAVESSEDDDDADDEDGDWDPEDIGDEAYEAETADAQAELAENPVAPED